MKILIECAHRNFEVYFKLCQVLYDKYPSASFAYFSRDIKTKSLFEESENPKFKIYDRPDFNKFDRLILDSNNFDYESDLNLIKNFEEYSEMTIWKMIAADRSIGWNDHIGNYGTYIPKDFRSTPKHLIPIMAKEIRGIADVFNDFKPDIFIPAMCMGSVSVFILEQMCKKSGVKYLLPDFSRVSNLHRFTEDIMCLSPEIDNDYYKILEEDVNDCQKGKKLFDEISDELSNLNNFDTEYLQSYGFHEVKNLFDSCNLFKQFFFEISVDLVNFIKSLIKSIRNPDLNFSIIYHKLKLSLVIHSQRYSNKKTVLDKSFGQLPQDGQKYLYFPLYNIPEYSSNFQSTMWLDIVSLVETLSKSIPGDWIIVLKEHPTGLEHNCRHKNFYDRINRIPNAMFAPLLANSRELIENAEIVFITVGTSGWEAILKGTPVLATVDNFWDCMGLSAKSSNIETLFLDIKKTVSDHKKISSAEREKRIITFLEALLNNSFPISNPEVFSYYYQGTKEQYSKQGIELANGLIDYIEKLKIDKNISNKKYFGSK